MLVVAGGDSAPLLRQAETSLDDVTAGVGALVEAERASDVVITMGYGAACPIFPGKRCEDWTLEDPAGQGLAVVRAIRDEIKARVQALIESLLTPAATP